MEEKEYFLNQSHCELIITSKEVSPEIITQKLNINPTRHYTKGEDFYSKNSGTRGKRFQNLWAIKSEIVVSQEESIANHLEFFNSILELNIQNLKKIKEDIRFEITFWIWIETENLSFGLELKDSETSFISDISNSLRFSIITNKSIKT